MRILLTAPKSCITRMVLSDLLAPEFSVRVITRDPSCLTEGIRDQVEMVHGSLDDLATLRRALNGVEAFLWCAPVGSMVKRNGEGYCERFARTACRAIREARTPRVVTIAVAGNRCELSSGPGAIPCAMEDIVSQSGAAVRHLRCGWLMDNFLRQAQSICAHGLLSYPMPGHMPLPMVAARDIVEAALQRLVRRDWGGVQSISMFGPQDLSFIQAAAVMERVLNRPLLYYEVSANDFFPIVIGSGAGIHSAQRLVAIFDSLAQGNPCAEQQTGEFSAPTTLAEWTRSELLPMMVALGSQTEPDAAHVPFGEARLASSFPLN